MLEMKQHPMDKDMTLDSLFEENDGKIDDERGEDLDQYLEVLMLDSTMTVVKAMKGGDVVLIVPCPHMDHKVNLNKGEGFFMVDLAEKARITKEKQLELADYCNEMTGCVGYDNCTYSLADAIESTDCPEEVFCIEGDKKHLARTDCSCDQHSGTTTGNRQILINLIRLQVELRRASNRAVKSGENLPIIKVAGLVNGRPFLPITVYSGLELSTLLQGGSITEGD